VSGAELERWLPGQAGSEESPPSLVCSRTSLEPLRLLRMPRQAWFLLCSGVLLAVGLGLSFAPLSHYGFWLVAAALGLAVVAAGVLWPSVLPAVLYGCEPGAAGLLLLLGGAGALPPPHPPAGGVLARLQPGQSRPAPGPRAPR